MNMDTRKYGAGTEITQSFPWGIYWGGKALCSDGKVRTLKRISQTADTFYSVPAAVEVRREGKRYTVSGYITYDTLGGYSTETDSDPITIKFVAYSYGKNGWLLPGTTWKGKLAYDERDVESCQDCVMLAANGETDDDCKIEPLTRVPKGWHLITCTSRDDDGECHPFFSWRSCDTCENPLAGHRHNCTMMTIERVLIKDGE